MTASANETDFLTCDCTKYANITTSANHYIFYILEILTNCIVINLICVFGIVGNSINILVLCKHGFQETTNIILVALAASDLLFCIILPMTRLKCIVSQFDPGFAVTLNTFVTVYLLMPKYVCYATSLCYVTVIAVERLVAVFFPFKVSRIFNRALVKTIVVSVPNVAIVALIPTFLALTFSWIFYADLDQTLAVVRYTKFYLDHKDFLDYYAWVGLNYFFCVSSIVITSVCCIAIGIKLHQAAVKRETMTLRSSGYDVRVVRMLVTICVVFLVVTIPNVGLFSYFVPNFIFTSTLHKLIDNFCAILYAINSSANFLVYVTMSKKFARTYKSLLCAYKY
ncbi:unnamed protein product [Candidula unifasciata]|uniref:G-protein coupled receptors family 1 profile domain-containing protein n=1 Tax=Candidula unifasciata TaxID=100452 RepID=A0A8S3YMP9_9EUPU|nr:unnamed protein product [Candidula unifasciata]